MLLRRSFRRLPLVSHLLRHNRHGSVCLSFRAARLSLSRRGSNASEKAARMKNVSTEKVDALFRTVDAHLGEGPGLADRLEAELQHHLRRARELEAALVEVRPIA